MDRRRLLQIAAAATGTQILAGCVAKPLRQIAAMIPTDPISSLIQSESIAVIGAGASGLAAAQELGRFGFTNVEIFEARGRTGGRIHAVPGADGSSLELGAGWVHGQESNSIYNLARQLSLPIQRTSSDRGALVWDAGGRLYAATETQKQFEFFENFLERARAKSVAGESLAQAIERQKARSRPTAEQNLWLNHYLRSYIVETEGADLQDLSGQPETGEGGAEGDDYLLLDGYTSMFAKIAAQQKVHLNARVRRIAKNTTGVKLEVDFGGQRRDVEFSAVIVCLPLGVLKRNLELFVDPLPTWKADSIQNIGFGHFCKMFLTFDEVFWPPKSRWLESMGDEPRITQFFAMNEFTGSKTLVAIAGGRQAQRWQTTNPVELKVKAMTQLRRQFGRTVPDPIAAPILSQWSLEPETLGAYAYSAKTTTVADFAKLAAPIDQKIFFAGEATSRFDTGTVHGAWDSGLRAAAEVRKRLS